MLRIYFRPLMDRGEDRDELARFLQQIGHLACGDAAAVHKQSEPIAGFLGFFETIANLRNKLGFRAAAGSLAKFGPNRVKHDPQY